MKCGALNSDIIIVKAMINKDKSRPGPLVKLNSTKLNGVKD